MKEKLKSKALEANLAETRYKDIKIPPDFQTFIKLSKKYFGIHKRANDCIVEYQHPFSNRKFVAEELRSILLTDYWFYIGLKNPNEVFTVPLKLLRGLLLNTKSIELRVMIIRTLLEFNKKLSTETTTDFSPTFAYCLETMRTGLKNDTLSFIMASKYFGRYLKSINCTQQFSEQAFSLTRDVFNENLNFWENSSTIERWLEEKKDILTIDHKTIENQIGAPWFEKLHNQLKQSNCWDELVEEIPDYDQIAEHFADAVDLFPSFMEKFHFIFYLLQLPGISTHKERLIWKLNKILSQTIDEIEPAKIRPFVNQLFEFAAALRESHTSSVLDMMLTLGKKAIDLDSPKNKLLNYFENKLIDFGFETPGVVFVNEDWQLSVNDNHIKNIRIWLELIEYSQSNMERLLSTLIVNLQLGGIFISDTDLFQREITKILNSNIAPHYKKVKQLTRIFPVYFNEIGAEGEIRKVTTTMDEISQRKDMLIHFLRKQVHTESNNTLIELTRRIFGFWGDGKLTALKNSLPENVYNSINKKSEWFAPIHGMVKELCKRNNSKPDELLALSENEFEQLLNNLTVSNDRDKERLGDIRTLYDFLKEKYSFDTVDITDLLKRFSFIEEAEISKLRTALDQEDFENSLKLIYDFMNRLKEIIFNPKPSKSWENIYHKRHIAIGIPSMYGVYREPKFEALGLTFRLENVATRLMEKVVAQINLNYISAKTLNNIHSILDYFREGLELDGITNQSFNANLLMLKYSLRSQSFSFEQYINIFQFIAADVKRIIVKYFLKTYEIPLRVVIPQLLDPDKKLSEIENVQTVNKVSEEFYRDVIADAFLMQPLDNFIARILESLRDMVDNLDPILLNEVMSYNSNLIITRLKVSNPVVDNQVFLGSKAYHLKILRMAKFPIPPGFVITTEVFRRHKAILGHPELKKEMHKQIRKHLRIVEKGAGKQYGNLENPLLLSVRSGSAISMPGAMDTFLNVGLNDEIAESMSQQPEFEWSAWDSYRRLLQSWGMAFGLSRDVFDEVIERFKIKYNVEQKIDFTPVAMREVAMAYKQTLKDNKIVFEEDVFQQLIATINMVFESWSSKRAIAYREHLEIADEWGTAVIVQRMIFGNLRKTSGTGVVFTQNPKKQKQGVHLYGDFTLCSQGEDIVSGLVKPFPVSKNQKEKRNGDPSLQEQYPEIYDKLNSIAIELTEHHGYSPQEIEFTFESENPDDLYILQTRDLDMSGFETVEVFSTSFDKMKLAGRGIGIGGSAMNGRIAFDNNDIEFLHKKYPGESVILVRPDTVPDDIAMIFATDGLLTGKGGATSHAAVTAVRLGKTSVVNCSSLTVFDDEKKCLLNKYSFQMGDPIAIDGYLGNVYQGNYPIESGAEYSEFRF